MPTLIVQKSVLCAMAATACAIVQVHLVAAVKTKAPPASKKTRVKNPQKKSATGSVFQNYRRWECANREAFWVPAPVAALCAAPMPLSRSVPNPHAGKFIHVYVNPIARDAMLKMKSPQFPRGSIIVKEKLPTAQSSAPELLTAMVKRETGFDAANGDWEYLVLNGSATQIQQRGKLSNCQGCHEAQKETDYVFRNYLPSEVQNELH